MKKCLVVYYSYSKGNTKTIAVKIGNQLHCDIEAIELIHDYQGSYDEVVDQGLKETKEHYQPDIKPLQHNINDYDVIVVGTPTWWYSMAPAVLSFLKQNNFKDKIVIPYMTNAGWPGSVVKDMQKACNGNCVLSKEFKFSSEQLEKMETSQHELQQWINEIENYLERN